MNTIETISNTDAMFYSFALIVNLFVIALFIAAGVYVLYTWMRK